MAAGRNGNGRRNGSGGPGDVPHWVRTLFDQHETHMAALSRTIEEIRTEGERRAAEHEARMARLERTDLLLQKDLIEARRQTREIVKEISRLDTERKAESAERKAESAERKAESAERKAESARNLAEHRAIMAELRELRDLRERGR